ncbi:MAG TPA: glycosyltransferase family 2 protein [Patescibacteria group bacterium]|nr:glycosyltransferase family 2 protein [Patescibacteria group bacterium]
MKKALPFISIIIPAFNEEKMILHCLDAIKNQSYPKDKFEIILANNNSTDKTVSIAEKQGAKIITETQEGYIFTLNTGMKAASGEIIAVTDADTIVTHNWLETMAIIFQDPDVVAVTGSITLNMRSTTIKTLSEMLYRLFLQFNFASGKPHLSGPNFAIRKDIFMKINGLNTLYELSGDVELGLRAKKYGKVSFTKDLKVFTSPRRWRMNPFKALNIYGQSYFSVIWLKRPPKMHQIPVR